MGIKLSYQDSNEITGVVDDILKDLKITKEQALKLMRPRIKRIAVDELRKIRRIKNIQKHRYRENGERRRNVHLYQDVITKITKDEYGDQILKVGGGSRTGTLWHIVNDGTYKTQATHFMDRIIEKAEKEFDDLIQQQLERMLDR